MDQVFHHVGKMAYDAPLIELNSLFPPENARVLLKLETFGPTGTVKDRVVDFMLDAAFHLGLISSQTKIVEASAGGEGLALAAAAARRGLPLTLFAPEGSYDNSLDLLRDFGATLEFTPKSKGMTGAMLSAAIAARDPSTWTPGIFDNPANPGAHEATTGPEIWRATRGRIDAFVAGIGSGGTFTGTSRYLIRRAPSIELVAVEPQECAVLSGGAPSRHGIVGLGAGFIPKVFDRTLPYRTEMVATEEAARWTRLVAQKEGLAVGISTGANLAVAARLARQRENKGKTIVTIAFSLRSSSIR